MIGFGDAGERVRAVEPVFPGDHSETEIRRAQREAITGLLAYLVEVGTVADAGGRALVLASVCKVHGAPRTCRELGRALGTSHVTASRLINKFSANSLEFLRDSCE